MGWRGVRLSINRFVGLPFALMTAALTGGCFQPLYGTGPDPAQPGMRDRLSAVDVQQIDAAANTPEARMAVQVRNDLLFSFTGGGSSYSPTHRLKIVMGGARSIVQIDRASALPNIEFYVLRANYSLTEMATGKVVVTGQVTTNVSYDTMGQQRYARISGMKDAEARASKVISENITTRLASYFVSGS